jgi:hypothetical protein
MTQPHDSTYPPPSIAVLEQDWSRRLDGILEQVRQLRAEMLASGHYPGEELAQAMLLLHWARASSVRCNPDGSKPHAKH